MLAVILKKSVFAEGSEVVTLYSRDEGKVRAVARSVKSAKSKLSFGLQDLFLSDVEVAVGRHPGGLPLITGVKAVDTFMRLRESDRAVHLALFATELLLKSTPDHEPQPALYDHFVSYLQHLDSALPGSDHSLCRTCYTLKFLDLIGYGLSLEQCVQCKRVVPAPGCDVAYFSVAKSGFACGEEAGSLVGTQPVVASVLHVLAATAARGFDEQDAAGDGLPSDGVQSVSSAIQGFAVHVLERELKTARYV